MNDEPRTMQKGSVWPVVVHPGPASIEDLLGNIDPAPDEETERFIAAIYADRHDASETTTPQ